MNFKKYIGDSIRNRRKFLEVKQADLAEIAEISVNTLYKIERGEGNPTIEVLAKIWNTLGLELQIDTKTIAGA